MTLHLSYLVCPSGLGHLMRTLGVVNHVIEMMPDICITLHLGAWQIGYARKRIPYSQIRIEPVGVPFILTPEGRREWTYAALADTKFDFLVSDNLMEASIFHEKVVIVGSFMWGSNVKNFRDGPLWIKTNKMRIPIFGNATFAMPPVRELSGFQPVGLIGKCVKNSPSGENILFSFGRSDAARDLCGMVRKVICPNGKPIEGIIFDDIESDEPAGDYSEAFFAQFSSAVIRPGIGTVSDCLRYGVPMVVLHEEGNDEMDWNTKILLENGLASVARTANEALQQARAWNDKARRSDFHRRRHSLRWEGEKEIAAGIVSHLEELR